MQKKNNEPVATNSPAKPVDVPAPVLTQPGEKKQYTECKIQIRLTNGATMVQSFKPTEPLAAVSLIYLND